MNKQFKDGFRVVLILAVGSALAIFIASAKPKPAPAPSAPPPPPTVDVVSVVLDQRHVIVKSQGTVTPKREIDLVTQVAGQVVAVADSFAPGGFFAAGESLVQIDPRDYRIALVEAESVLADARQALALEKGRALQAKREWRDLGNTDANDLFLRKPQLAAAEAAVAAAEARVEQARLNLERTSLSAPFAGRIESIAVNTGQYVAPGRVVAHVFSTEVLEVRLPLTASQVHLLSLQNGNAGNLPVTLLANAGNQEYRWQARLVRTEASVDTQSRLFFAVAEVAATPNNANGNSPPLTVGQFVHANIQSNLYPDIAVLPREALYEKTQVLVLNKDNQVQLVGVQVLQSSAKEILVKGLREGQRVVATPPGYVTENMRLAPRQTGQEQPEG